MCIRCKCICLVYWRYNMHACELVVCVGWEGGRKGEME